MYRRNSRNFVFKQINLEQNIGTIGTSTHAAFNPKAVPHPDQASSPSDLNVCDPWKYRRQQQESNQGGQTRRPGINLCLYFSKIELLFRQVCVSCLI